MSEEWIIEIELEPEPFKSSKEAEEWAKKNIKKRAGVIVNAVSRDINVIEI